MVPSAGPGQYALRDPRPGESRQILVHTYRPAAFTPASPVVLVVHGRNRNGDEYRDFWIESAERYGLLVAAPQFSEAQYPQSNEYAFGAVMRADGSVAPRERWLFGVIDAVFRDVRSRAGSKRDRYFLFGHSAGAQLVHRMVTLGGPGAIERAIAANAGSYTLPVRDEPYPFGLGGVPITDEELRAAFSRPLLVMLGESDNDPGHEHLPREQGAMRQGPHRFARGQRYMEVARREAARLGVPLAWRLSTVPGIAHSGKEMSPFAARELFGAGSPSLAGAVC